MDVTTVTATKATTAQPAGTASRISSDFDTFLKMLTTQMQNQDPLNPIDSADYAVQLATFSGVEQQTKTNQLIEQLLGQLGGDGLAAYAGWVGKQVSAPMPVAFAGDPLTLDPAPATGADRVVLAVRDSRGTLVAREDVPVDAESWDWTGEDITGGTLPDGYYTLTLESWAGDAMLSERVVESYARVAEVRTGTNGVRLVLDSGFELGVDDVTALREAG